MCVPCIMSHRGREREIESESEKIQGANNRKRAEQKPRQHQHVALYFASLYVYVCISKFARCHHSHCDRAVLFSGSFRRESTQQHDNNNEQTKNHANITHLPKKKSINHTGAHIEVTFFFASRHNSPDTHHAI